MIAMSSGWVAWLRSWFSAQLRRALGNHLGLSRGGAFSSTYYDCWSVPPFLAATHRTTATYRSLSLLADDTFPVPYLAPEVAAVVKRPVEEVLVRVELEAMDAGDVLAEDGALGPLGVRGLPEEVVVGRCSCHVAFGWCVDELEGSGDNQRSDRWGTGARWAERIPDKRVP